jgi:hypothetical protein
VDGREGPHPLRVLFRRLAPTVIAEDKIVNRFRLKSAIVFP